MPWYLDFGIIAIFLSGGMALAARSKLSLATHVFCYLIALMVIQSICSELHPEGKLKVFPSIPLVILLQWYILHLLGNNHIRAKITPYALNAAMLFGSVCIVENLLGERYFVLWYGMVIGCTSLLAALEGAYYAGRGILSKRFTGDRRNRFQYSWLSQSLQVIKKD